MSTTVKTGWLNDKNGDKFAPKTLTSQVQTSDGTLLEDKIQADLDAAKTETLEESKKYTDDIPVVKYDAAQELTDEQKTQARENIVAVSTAELTAKAAELTAEIESKVEKVDGMGLSSNDYTDAEQAKLGTVEEGATATSIVIKTWTSADII